MVTLNFQGRLCNNLIQFFAAYFFSKKHSLCLNLSNIDKFYDSSNAYLMSIMKECESHSYKTYQQNIVINDDNFLSYYKADKLCEANFLFNGFFQQKWFLSSIRQEIKNILKIKYENIHNKDVFIHYRLGDITNSKYMLPLEYYIEAMEIMGNPKGYISSDTINHENCQFLINNYNLQVFDDTPWNTILFAKNFDNLILSEGTFSAMIGLLSRASTVICNIRDTIWCGEICQGLDEYYKLCYDYDPYPNVVNKKVD